MARGAACASCCRRASCAAARCWRSWHPAARPWPATCCCPGGTPCTLVRFNAVVSPHRVFDTRRFTIDEFKRIRSPGARCHAARRRAGRVCRRPAPLPGRHGELPGVDLLRWRRSSAAPVGRGGGAQRCLAAVHWAPTWPTPCSAWRTSTRRPRAARRWAAPCGRASTADLVSTPPPRWPWCKLVAARRWPAAAHRMAACTLTHVPGPRSRCTCAARG
jgi:hypothetical protein